MELLGMTNRRWRITRYGGEKECNVRDSSSSDAERVVAAIVNAERRRAAILSLLAQHIANDTLALLLFRCGHHRHQ